LAVSRSVPEGGAKTVARLLVTGFGPFPGVSVNPSAEVARRVAASPRWRRLGIEAQALVLPTAYASVAQVLTPVLRDGGFDAVLMIGVASRARRIRVERRAANRASILFPDASGQRGAGLTFGRGPAHRLAAGRPFQALRHLRRHRLPAAISQDAGRYLCNTCYFAALAEPMPVLFLHIPKAPRRRPRRAAASRRPGATWPERLAAAFVDIGLDLLAQARRQRLKRGAPRPDGRRRP
jgi:pyroglutamyl-peptidase